MLRALLIFLLLPTAYAQNPSTPATTGWDSYSELQNGNIRFMEGKSLHPHQGKPLREELAQAQKPHAIVLSCSDSRLPPELIFDQGLGDLYMVRVAGNVVNAEAIASIEYAIQHFRPKFLLVMGHESCDAVGAALHAKANPSGGSESQETLLQHINSHFSRADLAAPADSLFREAVKANVAATMKELLHKSDIVAEAVRNKGLVLAQGIYSLKTGRVEFWDVGTKSDIVAAAAAGMATEAPVIKEENIQEEIIPEREIASQKKPRRKATSH